MEKWPRFKTLTDILLSCPSQRCSWVQCASSALAPSVCRSHFPGDRRFSSCLSQRPWNSYSSTSSTSSLWLLYCLKTSLSWCQYLLPYSSWEGEAQVFVWCMIKLFLNCFTCFAFSWLWSTDMRHLTQITSIYKHRNLTYKDKNKLHEYNAAHVEHLIRTIK